MASPLDRFPHPHVAVDVALLTVCDGRLSVLLHRRADRGYAAGKWSLPGAFLRVQDGERLRDTALRALRDKVGVTGESPRQLCVFDDPDRDDRGRVLSVAHVDLVPAERLDGARDAELVPVGGHGRLEHLDGRGLPFDHDAIVEAAVRWARSVYAERPDPARLVREPFTLLDLRRVHEAVAGERIQKDVFRRRVADQLRPTGRTTRELSGAAASSRPGRPAELFEHGGAG